jgi:hypothetical protein
LRESVSCGSSPRLYNEDLRPLSEQLMKSLEMAVEDKLGSRGVELRK